MENSYPGRYCHTTVAFNNNLYIFGGCILIKEKGQRHRRQPAKVTKNTIKVMKKKPTEGGRHSYKSCTKDLILYNTRTSEFKRLMTHNNGVRARRNHVAAVIGNNMIIYGGMDNIGTHLSDIWAYNFLKETWRKLSVKKLRSKNGEKKPERLVKEVKKVKSLK